MSTYADGSGTSVLLSQELPARMCTSAAADASLASTLSVGDASREGWQRVIDEKLVEWGRDPDQVAEADLIPPTRRAVDAGVRCARRARDGGVPPPLRVVPDGDGGIVFERWQNSLTETIEISCDGTAEYVFCRGHEVVSRVSVAE